MVIQMLVTARSNISGLL